MSIQDTTPFPFSLETTDNYNDFHTTLDPANVTEMDIIQKFEKTMTSDMVRIIFS